MKQFDIREDYTEEEKLERQCIIESKDSARTIINNHKNLWVKVIKRSINDAALMRINIPKWEDKLKKTIDERKRKKIEIEIEKMNSIEDSALAFLFNPDHKIPWDDFTINVQCPKCKNEWKTLMSVAAEQTSKCSKCKYDISAKYIQYRITEEYKDKEITLEELLYLFEIENIEEFRDKAWKEIEYKSQNPNLIKKEEKK